MMGSVFWILARIPNKKTQLVLFYWAQHHWIWPTPLCINSEEPRNKHTGECIRIKLANASNQQSPIHTAKESGNLNKKRMQKGPAYEYYRIRQTSKGIEEIRAHIGINTAPFCPKLQTSKSCAEVLQDFKKINMEIQLSFIDTITQGESRFTSALGTSFNIWSATRHPLRLRTVGSSTLWSTD